MWKNLLDRETWTKIKFHLKAYKTTDLWKSLLDQNTSSCFFYGNKIGAVCSHWEPKFCWINLSAESIVIKLLENESGLHCFKKWQNVLRDRGAADKRRHICGLQGTSNLKHHCTTAETWWCHWMLGRAFMIIWETFKTLELVSLCVFHKRFSAQNTSVCSYNCAVCTTGDLYNVVIGGTKKYQLSKFNGCPI